MLPHGDHTPINYQLPITGSGEVAKRLIRRIIYPLYNIINHWFLSQRYSSKEFKPDLWLWGQRGNDYERHRRRVSGYLPIKKRDILVAGCGTARDIESWVKLEPRRVIGIDWFSYERAWSKWKQRFEELVPSVEVNFAQADLSHMTLFPDASFDLVSSDAVFEHLKNLPDVLSEFHRVLRPGGLVYATFGPLWFSWGGDHVSGYDVVTSGFNHLVLEHEAYLRYLDNMGEHTHSEHDGRTWIKHDLFSRLKPREYLRCLEAAGFERLFVGAIIEPNMVACLGDPSLQENLLNRFDLLDLQVSAMSIIYRKKIEKTVT